MSARWTGYLGAMIPRRQARWSIGIYSGENLFDLAPAKELNGRSALGPEDLEGLKADGVADPFLVQDGSGWLMFFEVENSSSGKGEIGLARSADGLNWKFDSIVLAEPFHLSYPHVFEWQGRHFMIPESAAAGAVRLYEAVDFPRTWQLCAQLLEGNYVDATPFMHDGGWWMFALEGFRGQDALRLFHAEQPWGLWSEHPASPVVAGNRKTVRPAGSMLDNDGQLVRFAQDYQSHYGRQVRACVIEELTRTTYRERVIEHPFVLEPGSLNWNPTGMHHVDAHRTPAGTWLVAVDGRRTVIRVPILSKLIRRLRAEFER